MPQNPPAGYPTVSSYAVVDDPTEVIGFVEGVLSGNLKSSMEGPDGKIRHAELVIGDSLVMVGGSGGENKPFPAMLHVYVDDVDGAYRRALQSGGTSIREPEDMFYGDRTSGVRDSQGNEWWFSTHVEDVSPEEMARRSSDA